MSCSRSKPKGKRRLRGAKTPTADLVDMPKAVSKSPSWDPGQLFGAHYDDNISGTAGDGDIVLERRCPAKIDVSVTAAALLMNPVVPVNPEASIVSAVITAVVIC